MNIFAEELQELLEKHGEKIQSLYNTEIHRETVRRLINSFNRSNPSYPLLNLEDLLKVEEFFGLTEGKMIRLRTAILATAIERALADRINIQEAYIISRQTFKIILDQSLAPKPDAPRIFVSHSSRDNAITAQLVSNLRALRAFVWVDFEDISHGDYMKHINEGLK